MRLSVFGRQAPYIVLAAAFGCGGDGPTAPPAPPAAVAVADVRFDVSAVSMHVGQERVLAVSVTNAAGAAVTGRTIVWASTDTTVAKVTSSGVVTALGLGAATVSATVEGKAALLPVSVTPVPVKEVTVGLSTGSVYVGRTIAATASVLDSAKNTLKGRVVAWSSSNSAIATVDANGTITGVAPGNMVVTAEVEGIKGTASVAVSLVPVTLVTVSPASASLYVGGSVDLSASAADSSGHPLTGRAVTWSTTNNSVATVSSTGVVTAVAPGQATIIATVEGKTASASITVTVVPVASVAILPATARLYIGSSVDMSATAKDSAGNTLTGRSVSWSTSNAGVLTVSSTGVATAVAAGTAVVTATVEGKAATATVTVSVVPVASVTVVPASVNLYVDGSLDLSATAKDSVGNSLTGRTVTWSTSNSSIASVTSAGVVTAVAPGTATITATVEGKTATATVTVTVVPVATVSVVPPSVNLYVGGSVDLSATAKDSAGNPLTGRGVTWSSSNTSVASISSAGRVTAVAAGTVTITATVEGKTASATVTVSVVPVASVSVSPATATLYVGQTVDLGAVAKDSAGNTLTGRAITWSSSNTGVATVSSTGLVTAVAAGNVVITATVEGKTGTATITSAVVSVASISLSSGDATLYPTAIQDYDANASDSAGNALTGRPVTWSTSNPAIASVSSTGLVTALAQGTASITATVEGKTASATITVRHDPIVFVHGFASVSSVWSTMTSRFAADGWRSADMVSWSYNSLQSNVTTAGSLQTTVDSVLAATGAKRVDIITHSMGGLSSRYYIKNLGGTGKVDAWVSLGGPNHGTDTAAQCAGVYVACAEMQAGSGFLTGLNSGDETPGTPRYATWWSPCDTTINPDDTVALSGATNTQTACLGHSQLYSDLTTYGQVRDFVR